MNSTQLSTASRWAQRGTLAACLPLLLLACSKPAAESEAAPIPVKTVQLGADAHAAAPQFPVTVVRDREANVSFRVGGVVQALSIHAGQSVHAGQVLASLQATPYVANRARAESELSKLQHAANRNTELLQAGAISSSTRDDTSDALAAAKAALQAAQYDEQSATLKAPFDGVILSKDADMGETVAPGQRVLRLADLHSAVIAKAAVPASVARQLRAGSQAQVRVGDKLLPGRVRSVGALSDPKTANVTVDLVLSNAAQLASGSVGSVVFTPPSSSPAAKSSGAQAAPTAPELLLPPEALLESKDGVGAVYVLDPTTSVAHRTRVQVLGFDGEWLRIQGLPSGAKVLTAGAGFVADGQKVQEIHP